MTEFLNAQRMRELSPPNHYHPRLIEVGYADLIVERRTIQLEQREAIFAPLTNPSFRRPAQLQEQPTTRTRRLFLTTQREE